MTIHARCGFVEAGVLWRLMARCAPDSGAYVPLIDQLVTSARGFVAAGHDRAMRHVGARAVYYSLILDQELLDRGRPQDFVDAWLTARELMGLYRFERVSDPDVLFEPGPIVVSDAASESGRAADDTDGRSAADASQSVTRCARGPT